ncbi:MAG: hypothetical protein ACP5UQ_07460 [Anaerolineae bacterium]
MENGSPIMFGASDRPTGSSYLAGADLANGGGVPCFQAFRRTVADFGALDDLLEM